MSKMFRSVHKTWNPCVGCRHWCAYCWANDLALRMQKQGGKYKDGFEPRFFPKELEKQFKSGQFVFVVDMGDLFGSWVPVEWIQQVLDTIKKWPETDFLLMTKNPKRYHEFEFTDNVVLGTTLESNREYDGTLAPTPWGRFVTFSEHPHVRKFISIEPIMDFDLGTMLSWVRELRPEIVEVGADSYGHKLPEPDTGKIMALIIGLESTVPKVNIKDSMKRLGVEVTR